MEKVRIGLIGCGGRAKAHMNSYEQLRDIVEVVAVADPIEARRDEASARFGGARKYVNHIDFFEKESAATLDAILIAVEPTAHTGMEEMCIEKGIPFCIEKPMTLDLAQGERIVAGLKEKNLITSVGFQDRYLDLIQIIKNEMPNHKQGGLVYGSWIGGIPGVWWWQKKSTCGGQLVEQNIHLLDGLRFLYGEPLSVYATCSRGIVEPGVTASAEYDTDDHSTVVLRFQNNVTATLCSACYMRIGGSRHGYYILMNDIIFDYRLRNNLIITDKDGVRDIPRGMDQTKALDEAFLNAVRTGNRSLILSDYEDAFKSLRLGFECNRSMDEGQVIYF